MAVDGVRGPAVPAKEMLYRAILYPLWWAEKQNRPSTAAFDAQVFSVDIASLTTPKKTRARFNIVLELVEFPCGGAREIGFDAHHELDENDPDNQAHAHVYFDQYGELGDRRRKRVIRRLAELCVVVPA